MAAALLAALAAGAVGAAPRTAAAAGEAAAGVVYEGDDRAVVRLSEPLAAAVAEYANAGYRLRRGPAEGEATIEVGLAPFGSRAPFVAPASEGAGGAAAVAGDDAVARAARTAVAGASTVHQAVGGVLGWMAHHVRAEPAAGPSAAVDARASASAAAAVPPSAATAPALSVGSPAARERTASPAVPPPVGTAAHAPAAPRPATASRPAGEGKPPATASGGAAHPAAPSSPSSSRPPARPPSPAARQPAASHASGPTPAEVLARGAGDAAAVARLAVAMLGAVGIEARAVRGIVVGPPRPGAPRGPHAWIEVRYPDRGWAFSDPLHHHHYVPATYLRLAGDPAPAAGAAGAELVERRDRRLAADVHPAAGPGIGARGNGDGQVAAALRVVVPGGGEGAAVLTDASGAQRRLALLDGEGVFVGLAGGAYTLEVLVAGRPALSRAVDLPPRERSAVYFATAAAARREEPSAAPREEPPATGGRSGPARRRAPEER